MALAWSACSPAEPPPSSSNANSLFVDVSQVAGLGDFYHETGAFGEKWFPESMGSGGGFIDYNGDGWLDILLAGGGVWPESKRLQPNVLWLYKNMGDGHFEQVTDEAGLGDVEGYSIGIGVADYDNDGDQDFYLTTLTENRLFRNEGGTFTDVTVNAGVGGVPNWSSSAVFFDADRDGWLDLYAANYVAWTPKTDKFCTHDGEMKGYCTPEIYDGVPGRFYHNNGDGTFTDWTEQAGLGAAKGMTLGLLVFDYNRDIWPDLMLANDTQPDQLFENNGDGTFSERGAQSGIAYDEKGRARAGMGIDSGIVDSTGEVTIFVGNFSREMIGVYRHTGKGYFMDMAARSKIGRPSLSTLTFGLSLLDIDLDGDLDLFAANGHVQPDIEKITDNVLYAEPAHVFMNRGDGIFEDVAAAKGGALMEPLVARGSAYGDYDQDGDLDLLITENGRGVRLWRNETNAPHFVRVKLEGKKSNRNALGTRIVAIIGQHRMEQFIRGGGSYLAASEQVATFGLGEQRTLDSLYVYWPSGRLDRFAGVQAGSFVTLTEGDEALEIINLDRSTGN